MLSVERWTFSLSFLHSVRKLPMNVPPFAHPRERKKAGFAKPAQGVPAGLLFSIGRRFPYLQQGQKIRIRIGEGFVSGRRSFLVFLRALARIGYAQSCRDD